jgi:hypothetical protein
MNIKMKKKTFKCIVCNKKFLGYKINQSKYCSRKCYYKDRLLQSVKKYKTTKNHLKKLSKFLIIWLVGFWEGEGCLSIKRDYYNKNTNKQHYKFGFLISQKDKQFISSLQTMLGFGQSRIHTRNGFGSCYVWELGDLGEILAIVEVIHPYIKLKHRKEQINKFLNNYRVKLLTNFKQK